MLHETTRKWICRRLFMALCLAPTLLVVGAIGYYHRPWRMAMVNQDLSGKLHAAVTVGQAWQPRPGVTEYRSIQLRDLRTGKPLLEADCVCAERRSGTKLLRFHQVKLPETGLVPLVRLLETWIATPGLAEIHFQLEQVVWPCHRASTHQASNDQESGHRESGLPSTGAALNLEHLQIHGMPDTDPQGRPTYQIKAQAECRMDGQVVPLRLVAERRLVESGPTIQMTLDLEQGGVEHAGLPGWMLQGVVPGGPSFQEARFRGVIHLETDLRHVRGKLRGQLTDLQLQRLLPRKTRHQCSGEATIDWDHLHWQDGRVREAQGILRAGRGVASQSLVADAVKLLYCQAAVDLGSEPSFAFDELACRFQLQAAGLTVWGECELQTPVATSQARASENRTSGCLLARRGMPLLWQSKYIVPVAQLVRLATSPSHRWTLPATRESQRLAQMLPLPGTPEIAGENQGQTE